MKADCVREFGSLSGMRVEELLDSHLAPMQVVLHWKAAGVNSVDTYIRAKTYASKPEFP